MCEEFAPRNGAARVRGERGANRALEKAAGPGRRRGICVKNLLPGTELQGLAGNGEQTAPWKSRPPGRQSRNSRPEVRARKPKTKGLRGAEREPCRPAGLQSRNSRPEVRARKPKTKGSRGVEREPCRPPGRQTRNTWPEVRARKPKTKGLRGVEREPCRPAGPSHFRRARPGRPPSPLCFPAGRAPIKKHRAAARCLLLSY